MQALPTGWCRITVAEGLATIIDYRGKTPPKSSSGVTLISAANVKGGRLVFDPPEYISEEDYRSWTRRGFTQPRDVLITTEAPAGQVAEIPSAGRYQISRRVMALRADEARLHSRFLLYALQSPQLRSELLARNRGTTVPRVLKPDITGLLLPCPPLDEQRRIAAILGALDDKIELIRRMNQTLEELAHAIFKSWFIDFGGHDDLVDSEIGPVPRAWGLVPVSEAVDEVFDGPHATPAPSDHGAVFLGIGNLTGTGLDLSSIRYIAETDWPRWTKRVEPRPGDIVFCYEARLGDFAILPPGLRCCLGRRMALIRPLEGHRDRHFLFHYFVGAPFQRFLAAHVNPGSTVDRILLKDFPRYPVLTPPRPLVEDFESAVGPLWRRIHASQSEATTLTQLRDALLPKLISGDLRVSEAEPLVGQTS